MTEQSLSGSWEICLLSDPNPPATLPQAPAYESQPYHVPSSWRWILDSRLDDQPYDLFHYPRHWNDAPAALLRRRFNVESRPGERVWVTFQGVLQRWMCFVNQVPLLPEGADSPIVSESFLPVSFDITDALQPGANELVVWSGAWAQMETPAGEKLTNPNGSWFAGLSRGIWQEVTLETRPAAALQELAVRTSTRCGQISLEISAGNAGAQPFEGQLTAQIHDAGRLVRSFEPVPVALQPGETQHLTLTMDWPDALRWSPENPHCYDLTAALSTGNAPGHTLTTRFGFREVWFEGHVFYLNGIRTNLRGDAWHYQGFSYQTREYARQWFAAVKAAGGNFVRLHAQPYPAFFLDMADEMGMLIVDESAIYGSSKNTQSDHPDFIAACRAHLQRLVRRDRNHPSVVIWSMQNEMRWVDGREGYRDAMPALTAAMRELDPTRPVIYDGDKRLVPAEWCDAFSLHYNIDGTVDEWDRSKPLLFGEHGGYHYVSPQGSADLAGQAAYLSFERAMQSMGENEALFVQYARRREVTGVTPFNLVHYSHWALPPDYRTSLSASEPAAAPRPNPALPPLAAAYAPVTILPDQLDRVFYAGRVWRSFSLFNDTEREQPARLDWSLDSADGPVTRGELHFTHQPGSIADFAHEFNLPAGDLTLTLSLFHAGALACTHRFPYRVYPTGGPHSPRSPLSTPVRAALFGADAAFRRVSRLLPGLVRLEALDAESLRDVDLLILGENLRARADDLASALDGFVRAGGSLLMLEQDSLTFGELSLSGRKFFAAHPNPAEHPIFAGLTPADLRFWTPDNPHADQWRGLVNNAFLKPVDGDMQILLECAEGSFGWGGLLWTPLVSYRLGEGLAIFSQLALAEYDEHVPQAGLLLRNLLTYLCEAALAARRPAPDRQPPVLAQALTPELVARARGGETILLPPLTPADAPLLSTLIDPQAQLIDADTYQLQRCAAPELPDPFAGVSAHDLFHIERVTYTPRTYTNRLIATHALHIPGAQPLLQDVHNPWRDYFINGMDGEWIKMAVATRCHDSAAAFTPRTYAARLPLGQGCLIFNQILPDPANPKVTRITQRLHANLGAGVDCDLFTHTAPVRERGIPALMGLARQPHQDESAMRAYFCSPDYTLNNLGEGVFGWMLRLELRGGWISIPDSAGQTWFLTAFLESEINRDPSRRAGGELPDPSIVPDLWLDANCPVTVVLNGQTLLENTAPPAGGLYAGEALLQRGLNRLALICRGGAENIRVNAWLLTKFSEPLTGLRSFLTLD